MGSPNFDDLESIARSIAGTLDAFDVRHRVRNGRWQCYEGWLMIDGESRKVNARVKRTPEGRWWVDDVTVLSTAA